ncbi:MAG: substrate-binding domain-containing protein [Actinomycetia bacterium]|nr:substrate-binding domain-containing protein [Actinomycetes bacterium]
MTVPKDGGLPVAVALFISVALVLVGCGPHKAASSGGPATSPVKTVNMTLASTTSTQDTGLFDVLIPAFEKDNPEILVKVVAVGSGEAIQMGKDGNADALLVHSPADEATFMSGGFGLTRKALMYNDFVVIGPANDPAGIRGTSSAADAFAKIAAAKAPFVSRGDKSGTNSKELKIWQAAGLSPNPAKDAWYKVTGQGMGDSIKVADESLAYTLSDRGTYLKMQKSGATQAAVLAQGGTDLLNHYHVIVVKDAKQLDAAKIFSRWIVGPKGQAVIKDFGVSNFGKPLFNLEKTVGQEEDT